MNISYMGIQLEVEFHGEDIISFFAQPFPKNETITNVAEVFFDKLDARESCILVEANPEDTIHSIKYRGCYDNCRFDKFHDYHAQAKEWVSNIVQFCKEEQTTTETKMSMNVALLSKGHLDSELGEFMVEVLYGFPCKEIITQLATHDVFPVEEAKLKSIKEEI